MLAIFEFNFGVNETVRELFKALSMESGRTAEKLTVIRDKKRIIQNNKTSTIDLKKMANVKL